MKEIKVLHIIGALNLGGAETMIMNIFRSIDRNKIEFDFFLSGNKNGYYEKEAIELGANIYNMGKRRKKPLKYIIELYKYIKKNKYEIIHIHATDARDGLAAVVAFFAGAKYRFLYSHNTAGQSKFKQRIMRILFMPFVNKPQACSKAAGLWMFGKKKFEIIPLPILCDKCIYDKEMNSNFKRDNNLYDCKIIGNIGRYQKQKNHIRLLEIFSEIIKKDSSYRLVLIGDGILKNEIDNKILELGLNGYVYQLGQLNFACSKMSIFDCLLFPSLYEGFPTVLLEAQANGLPIIASSTITPDIKLTDLVCFENLSSSNDEWIKYIFNLKRDESKCIEYNKVISSIYDISKVSNLFAEIYMNCKKNK